MSDIQRIISIPVSDQAPDLTNQFRRPNGKMSLRPVQSQALYEISKARGGILPIGVGHGKTLIAMLAGVALGAKRPLVLLPAPCVQQFYRDYQRYGLHFQVHPNIQVVSYSKLQVASGLDLIKTINPDVIIADEAHNLRNTKAARTGRVFKYLKAKYESGSPVTFVCLSGTLTSRGIRDFAHLTKWALHANAPVPKDPNEVICWSMVLDSGTQPGPVELSHMASLVKHYRPNGPLDQKTCREVFADRFTSTLGVVNTLDSSAVGCSLILRERKIRLPDTVESALSHLRSNWSLPNGEQEFGDMMQFARAASQICQGFYYKWDWPPGRPDADDKIWMEKRKVWNRAVRAQIEAQVEGLDSELLISNACRWSIKHGKLYPNLLPVVVHAWKAWEPVHRIKPPPTVPVWLDDFLIQDTVAWVKKQSSHSIVWYGDTAIGDALAKAGMKVYGQGTEIPEKGGFSLAASYNVHGTGKNLQAWSNQICLDPPTSGKVWEQLLGRTHRQGQTADEVYFDIYTHTPEFEKALESAKKSAVYIEETTKSPQRLLYATWAEPEVA
jgi:hypothetical protein